MAALYEGYTLCGLVPDNNAHSGIQGIEEERDSDHVVVTHGNRCVTLYKVSDQKRLSSWTVRQGQALTCPAVFNRLSNEYVSVSDHKVVRIWKEEDVLLDKAFKATVSSDVWRVHCSGGREPVVLFQRGGVRLLDALLSSPQQDIEDVLSPEETIRWSSDVVVETQQCVVFTTEQKGQHFLYLHRLKPNSVLRYRLETDQPGHAPLSFSLSYRDGHICLLYLYPSGGVYQSLVPVRGLGGEDGAPPLPLPRTLLLALPVGDGLLEAASVLVLDEAHVAVVGAPHPSAGAGKDFLCIWNTNFQTLQAGREVVGKMFGQMWTFSTQLFIPHGKTLSVIPFQCPRSSLAAAVGKLRASTVEDAPPPACVASWNNVLHGDKAPPPRVETRKSSATRRTQPATASTLDQVLQLSKTGPADQVQKGVEGLLSMADLQDLRPSLGQLASILVSRSRADPAFCCRDVLTQLLHTRCLCHSVCPDLVLLALDRRDYLVCQLCLQLFPDIPEAVTCACLKAFLSLSDVEAEDMEDTDLEPDSVSFMDTLMSRREKAGLQNGCSPESLEAEPQEETAAVPPGHVCPVGRHRAVLLNQVLQTAYSDAFILPHLKDMSSQQALLLLQYLQFLYLRCSEPPSPQTEGLRGPGLAQVLDWVCLLLDAHFTVLAMTPEARASLLHLHNFVKSQVKLASELGKMEGSLQELSRMKDKKDVGQYSIEVIELF